MWRATCEQDWELCENNFAGVESVAYEPGPFSEVTEKSVESFERWYLDRLAEGEATQRSYTRSGREPSTRG